jgi:hypothetical protein
LFERCGVVAAPSVVLLSIDGPELVASDPPLVICSMLTNPACEAGSHRIALLFCLSRQFS